MSRYSLAEAIYELNKRSKVSLYPLLDNKAFCFVGNIPILYTQLIKKFRIIPMFHNRVIKPGLYR